MNTSRSSSILTTNNADPSTRGDELALAFCFDILAGKEKLTFSYLHSLLRPWDWTEQTLLDRLNCLQNIGLLSITEGPKGRLVLAATAAGRRLSERAGLTALGSHDLGREPASAAQDPAVTTPVNKAGQGRPTGRPAPPRPPMPKTNHKKETA